MIVLISTDDVSTLQTWSLDHLCGVCSLFRIPFVVIVQPHLLRDKGEVRLRQIFFDSSWKIFNASGNDEFVKLDILASSIKKKLKELSLSEDKITDVDHDDSVKALSHVAPKDGEVSTKQVSVSTKVQCIYVETDQYYMEEKINVEDKSEKKAIRKAIKTSIQRATNFVSKIVDESGNFGVPVVAIDIPFLILRDYSTQIMTNGSFNIKSTCIHEKYPNYKKILKTLAMAIDNLVREHLNREATRINAKSSPDTSKEPIEFSVLLLSTRDDKFDLVTLCGKPIESHGFESKNVVATGRDNSARYSRKEKRDKGRKR